MLQRFVLFAGLVVCFLPVAAAQDTAALSQTFAIEAFVTRTFDLSETKP